MRFLRTVLAFEKVQLISTRKISRHLQFQHLFCLAFSVTPTWSIGNRLESCFFNSSARVVKNKIQSTRRPAIFSLRYDKAYFILAYMGDGKVSWDRLFAIFHTGTLWKYLNTAALYCFFSNLWVYRLRNTKHPMMMDKVEGTSPSPSLVCLQPPMIPHRFVKFRHCF